jgi:hypothetical protein
VPRFASPATESAEIAATATGRNNGSSRVSAVSATNRPLLVIEVRKSGPSPRPPPAWGGEIFTAVATMIGTAASMARPAQLRRRP